MSDCLVVTRHGDDSSHGGLSSPARDVRRQLDAFCVTAGETERRSACNAMRTIAGPLTWVPMEQAVQERIAMVEAPWLLCADGSMAGTGDTVALVTEGPEWLGTVLDGDRGTNEAVVYWHGLCSQARLSHGARLRRVAPADGRLLIGLSELARWVRWLPQQARDEAVATAQRKRATELAVQQARDEAAALARDRWAMEAAAAKGRELAAAKQMEIAARAPRREPRRSRAKPRVKPAPQPLSQPLGWSTIAGRAASLIRIMALLSEMEQLGGRVRQGGRS